MAHEIFISYSSKHRDLTRQLATVIETQYGVGSVWWDHALESWGEYEPQIRNALLGAKAVVVIWTQGAIQSNWVRFEADEAYRIGKLVHVRAPDIAWREMPPEYSRHHVKELDDTDGILRSIAAVWQGTPIRTELPLHEIYFRQHGHRIINPKRRPLARNPIDLSPTELLQAKYEAVPFLDVTDAKVDMLSWCTGERATAGRLLHGPGGLGKTRLMIDVATALRSQRWMAGFLDRPHEQVEATLKLRQQALDQLIDHAEAGEENGLLIVIDYAEGRPDEIKAIAQRLANRPGDATRPIRLVLLTRGAGDWWTALSDETPDVEKLFRRDDRTADVMALPPIATGAQRLALFVKSVEALAPLLRAQGFGRPKVDPDVARLHRIGAGEANTRPLAIQMEALLYLASATPETDAVGVDGLLRKILGIERDHWRKLLGSLDDDRARDMNRAVAQVTVVQGVNGNPSAERLLMADEFYKGQRTARVLVDPVLCNLVRVYGQPNGGVAYLEPDLIGEHHVASLADVELIEGCLRWIASEPDAEQSKRRRDLLTVLQRATQPEHGARSTARARDLLDHIIRHHAADLARDLVAVAVDTPGDLPRLLADAAPHLEAASVDALYWVMPDRSLKLDAAAAALASARTQRAGDNVSLSQKAERAGSLGIRLSALGRREEALSATQEAVDIYRTLAQDRPDAFLPDLAMSLNNIGAMLSALGRREEALSATQEAVDIRRTLAQDRPDAFLPDLASSLNNIGAMLSALGRREEALSATQEAVDIYRTLAQDRPDAFLPDLANTLDTMADILSAMGRSKEAGAFAREGLAILQPFAVRHPDVYGKLADELRRKVV